VRCHILKKTNLKNLSIQETVDRLLVRYFNKVKDLKKNYQNLKYVFVSIIPPSDFSYNEEYPRIGSLSDRVFVTQLVDKKIENWCALNSYIFLDLYDHYSDKEGGLVFSKSDHQVHVDPKTNGHIKDFLINVLYSNWLFL
jgi:hypothetical protein